MLTGVLESSESALAVFRGFAEDKERSRELYKRNLNLVDGRIRVVEVLTKHEMQLFLHLPFEIYKDDPCWPGVHLEEMVSYFDPAANPASYLVMKPFMAVRDGQVVGRVCAILNERYNQYWDQNIGFFGFFECINDRGVARELMVTVERYLQDQGKEGIYGPISPTIQDEVGVLLDSYDQVPVKGMAYNPPYYVNLLEVCGYDSVKDLVHQSTDLDTFTQALESKMHKLQPFIDDADIYTRCFDWDNLERDAEIVRDLFYHQTFNQHWGYYPVESEEWLKMLQNYRSQIYEDLFLIVEDAGEPIGFAVCFNDLNQTLHAERYGLEAEITCQKWDLCGVKPDYHRNGLGTFIAYNLLPGLKAHGIKKFCGSWALAENAKSIGMLKSFGMPIHSTYRVYQKQL